MIKIKPENIGFDIAYDEVLSHLPDTIDVSVIISYNYDIAGYPPDSSGRLANKHQYRVKGLFELVGEIYHKVESNGIIHLAILKSIHISIRDLARYVTSIKKIDLRRTHVLNITLESFIEDLGDKKIKREYSKEDIELMNKFINMYKYTGTSK